jgi:4-amino-4-deoxychorismate lyase
VPAADRGLAFGDGVFRTIAVRSGRALNWPWHYRRLESDCRLLRMEPPEERVLRDEVARVARGDAVVKVIVTRGTSTRGYAWAGARGPLRIVAAHLAAAYDPARARDGVTIHRCTLVLAQQPRLAGAKTLNRLENVLARSEWDDPAIAEGLLADAAGHVVEGTMSNLFVVKAGRVATPDLSLCGVVGAQRERVREILGADCDVRELSWPEVESADELFLTNSLIGAWPVARLGERRWKPGPVTRRVQSMIEEQDARD